MVGHLGLISRTAYTRKPSRKNYTMYYIIIPKVLIPLRNNMLDFIIAWECSRYRPQSRKFAPILSGTKKTALFINRQLKDRNTNKFRDKTGTWNYYGESETWRGGANSGRNRCKWAIFNSLWHDERNAWMMDTGARIYMTRYTGWFQIVTQTRRNWRWKTY